MGELDAVRVDAWHDYEAFLGCVASTQACQHDWPSPTQFAFCDNAPDEDVGVCAMIEVTKIDCGTGLRAIEHNCPSGYRCVPVFRASFDGPERCVKMGEPDPPYVNRPSPH